MAIEIIRGEKGCLEAARRRGIAIIVDALRASATITSFFSGGAYEVIVVSEVEDAFLLKEEHPDAVLAGERNFIKVAGFDLGNSPAEAASFPLSGRRVIFTSTSGGRRIIEAEGASSILVGSVINASAVAGVASTLAKKGKKDIIIIPACLYTDESFIAEEDIIASVVILKELGEAITPPFADHLERIEKLGIEKLFRETENGKKLASIGFTADIAYSSQLNITRIVPLVVEFIALDTGRKGAKLSPKRGK